MQLQVNQLHKSFGDNHVLHGITFAASSGAAFGLLGRNGAGKTTTIRIVMNVFPADSGTVCIDGQPIADSGVRFGYLPEERGLYPKQKIIDQLVYIGCLRGLSRAKARQNAERYLDRLGMREHANDKLATLSKGNQQKIQLAASIIDDPDVVILDEPFSGLDPINARLLKDVVREIIAEGRIVLFSSHQMGYVEEFCDQVAILGEGQILRAGSVADLKRAGDNRRVAVRLAGGAPIPQAQSLSALVRETTALSDSSHIVCLHEETQRSALLAALLAEGHNIEHFAPVQPTLEEIFVETLAGHGQTLPEEDRENV